MWVKILITSFGEEKKIFTEYVEVKLKTPCNEYYIVEIRSNTDSAITSEERRREKVNEESH